MQNQSLLNSSLFSETNAKKTITAIASPLGRGGIGVIRLSGGQALTIAKELCQSVQQTQQSNQAIKPRYAHFRSFFDAQGNVIDSGILLYFKAPNSFTGEDVIEIQGHGGIVLQQLLLDRLLELGATQAVAGEFSARAFTNDKIDLVQAEAIADVIDATSKAAAKSAIRSLTGAFSAAINDLLAELVHLRLYIEAAIDFPEEDIDFLADGIVEEKLTHVEQAVATVLETSQQGQLIRDGVQVVIAGKPNAGKSSLLNVLAGQERAIVTDVAGTTRDTLQETICLNGLTINLTDTAGLRETHDKVEKIGINRAYDAIESADLLLLVYDLSDTQTDVLTLANTLFGERLENDMPDPHQLLIIGNKKDLMDDVGDIDIINGFTQINISCAHQTGIDRLTEEICTRVGFHPPENVHIARTRHVNALKNVAEALNEAREQLISHQAGELVAEHLRVAQQYLGEITGEFTADDLLGEIFSSFCIGK